MKIQGDWIRSWLADSTDTLVHCDVIIEACNLSEPMELQLLSAAYRRGLGVTIMQKCWFLIQFGSKFLTFDIWYNITILCTVT